MPKRFISTALYLLCSLAILSAMYVAHLKYQHDHIVGETRAPENLPSTAPQLPVNPPLQLSIDKHHEFESPPSAFDLTDQTSLPNNRHSELFRTLNKDTAEDTVSISGELMVDTEEADYMRSLEGARIDLEIKTD